MEEKKLYTLEEAIAFLEANREFGVDCPCCKRFLKDYKITLSHMQGVGLILMVKQLKVGEPFKLVKWVADNVPTLRAGCDPELRKLQHWGFTTKLGEKDEDRKEKGIWVLNEKAIKFVTGEITVPKYFFRNTLIGEEITIQDVLNSEFSLTDLMER